MNFLIKSHRQLWLIVIPTLICFLYQLTGLHSGVSANIKVTANFIVFKIQTSKTGEPSIQSSFPLWRVFSERWSHSQPSLGLTWLNFAGELLRIFAALGLPGAVVEDGAAKLNVGIIRFWN